MFRLKYNITLILTIFTLSSSAQRPWFKERKIAKLVKKHVEFLASDALEGRYTASAGELKSAEYIAEQLMAIGVKPHDSLNSYYQTFKIVDLRMAQANSSLKIGDQVYTLFQDFYPLSPSINNGSFNGEIVNVGFGIEDEKLDHNDYQNKSVKGKTVLINIDLPGGTHPHSKFLGWSGSEFRSNYAKQKGVGAVLFYSKNKDLFPNGTLARTYKNTGLPVMFLKQDLSDISTVNGDLVVDILISHQTAHNVVGYIDNGSAHTVVIGAHHDHLGYGYKGGSLAERPGDIHNGADDNASGVAGLIELARFVKKNQDDLNNNNYAFVAFTGEEQGLVGSKFFVNSGLVEAPKTRYMINMDMIGHLDSTHKTLIINGVGTSPEWESSISKVQYPLKKIAKIKTTESGIGSSDHTSFYLAGVPSVHFFTGQHQYYHKPTDDIEIVNYGGEAFVISYIKLLMCEMDQLDEVTFTKTKDENQGRMNFNVTLGIMPDYVYDGEGLRVDGVKDGKTGYKAGLLKGDVIINMDGKAINDIQDYMKQLSSLKKGTKTTLTVRRGSETKVLDVQF